MPGFNMDDYVPVNERIDAFMAKYPEGSIQSEIVELTTERVTVKAYAYRSSEDARPGVGHSSLEIPGKTTFTRGSEIENAETSAWGRAIAALGFEVKRGIASAEEARNKQPQDGERMTGVRRSGSPSATTRPAAQPTTIGEAKMLLASVGNDHGLSFAQIEAKAKEIGVDRGKASVDDLLRVVAAIEQPAGGSAHPPAADPDAIIEDVLAVTGGSLVDPAAARAADESASADEGTPADSPSVGVPPRGRTIEEAIADAEERGKKTKVVA